MQNESGSPHGDQELGTIVDWGQILADSLSGTINNESFEALMNQANREIVVYLNLELDLLIHFSVLLESIFVFLDELDM